MIHWKLAEHMNRIFKHTYIWQLCLSYSHSLFNISRPVTRNEGLVLWGSQEQRINSTLPKCLHLTCLSHSANAQQNLAPRDQSLFKKSVFFCLTSVSQCSQMFRNGPKIIKCTQTQLKLIFVKWGIHRSL